jgi:hypothetical protein
MAHYERLSALDSLFLDLEDPNVHMHVGVVLLFDARPLRAPHGGLDMERIRAYYESRLALMPRYRQRLAYIPLERHPVWVDDDRFNLFYHIRHTALPQPGEERQLKRLCGRILSQKLDTTKPLWEIWVVEGLEGDRFALIAKTHTPWWTASPAWTCSPPACRRFRRARSSRRGRGSRGRRPRARSWWPASSCGAAPAPRRSPARRCGSTPIRAAPWRRCATR